MAVWSCKYRALGSSQGFERIFTAASYGHAVSYIYMLHCQDKLSVRACYPIKIECCTLVEV